MTRVLRCTRIKRRILRPTSLNGASAPTLGNWVPGTPCYGRAGSFIFALLVAAFCAFGAGEQPQPQQANVWRGIFPKPPDDAVKALQITIGTPFNDGYVFINGKYEPPPYRVERYGNVIRINGIQVSRQIVPWAEIAKTQKGFAVRRVSAEPDQEKDAAARDAAGEDEEKDEPSAPQEQPAAAAPRQNPVPHPRRDSLSLEELFGEKPAAARAEWEEPKIAERPAPAARPKPQQRSKRRTPAEVVVFDGEFKHDETTLAHLAKMNDLRTKIDSKLRAGGYIFFGTRYPLTVGNANMTKYMVGKLPDIMRRNTSRDAFVNDMHRAGLSFLPPKVMDDLFRNRLDFLNLQERAKKQIRQDKWRDEMDALK